MPAWFWLAGCVVGVALALAVVVLTLGLCRAAGRASRAEERTDLAREHELAAVRETVALHGRLVRKDVDIARYVEAMDLYRDQIEYLASRTAVVRYDESGFNGDAYCSQFVGPDFAPPAPQTPVIQGRLPDPTAEVIGECVNDIHAEFYRRTT